MPVSLFVCLSVVCDCCPSTVHILDTAGVSENIGLVSRDACKFAWKYIDGGGGGELSLMVGVEGNCH